MSVMDNMELKRLRADADEAVWTAASIGLPSYTMPVYPHHVIWLIDEVYRLRDELAKISKIAVDKPP